mgnify:CR=1 FL=1|tara:strand:+ start:123 stop:524 length:402 start_codon:yes stop_codon:yes gene_type:complete
MHPVEFTFYKALVLLSSAASIAFGITNLVYYNKIRTQDNCSEISSGEATTLIYLNLILIILAAIVFFWSLFRLIFSGQEKDIINTKYNLHTHNYPAVSPGDNSLTPPVTTTTVSSPDPSILSSKAAVNPNEYI